MADQQLFSDLQLTKPWVIQKVQENHIRQQISVELSCESKKRSWFSDIRDITCPSCKHKVVLPMKVETITVRHINLGNTRVMLIVPVLQCDCPTNSGDCPLRLYSNPALPYSKMLERQINHFLGQKNGANLAALALRLEVTELEQLLRAGWLQRDDVLPPISHPIWQGIASNQIPLITRNLGLQCLLTWVNGQLKRLDISETERTARINMVRTYFEKYQHTLPNELAQVLQHRGP